MKIKQTGCQSSFLRQQRSIFRMLAASVGVFLALPIDGTQPVYAEAVDRPNVLLIMTDDMGFSDLGCFGGEIETPNLDRLAGGGLRFTNFYSENMCWVSRAALLTGVYHKTSLYQGTIHPRCLTLPSVLRNAGYHTCMSGKWHLTGKGYSVYPVDRGFDQFYGILGGAASFFAPDRLTRNRANVEQEYQDPDYYITHAISDEAVEFVRAADKKQPLFLYVAYTAAHWPLHAPSDAIARYRGKYAPGWDKLRQQRFARMKQLGVIEPDTLLSPRHPDVPAWEDEPHKAWQQRRMEVYAAQVTLMDEGVGRVIQALKDRGRFDNTLILFTIDNGGCHVEYGPDRKGDYLPEKTRSGRPMIPGNLPDLMPGPENTYQSYGYGWANVSNTPFRLFKQFDHEGGIHTPMIAHWPRQIANAGQVAKQTTHLIDIMPTVLQATATSLPSSIGGKPRIDMDGISLLPALRGQPQAGHDELYFFHARGKAVRCGDWKLVRQGKQAWELYNIESDPNELHNLADGLPEKLAELQAKWNRWQNRQAERSKL